VLTLQVAPLPETDAGVFGRKMTVVPSGWSNYWTATRSESGGLESSYALDRSKGNIRELLFTPAPMAVRCVR